MRHVLATALTGLAVIAAGHAAQAQSLVSADNPNYSVFAQQQNAAYPLDGSNTTLSFKTSKANEAVQLTFSGFCGAKQTATDGSGGAITSGFVQSFFVIDGNLVGEAGNANALCYWQLAPINTLSSVGNAVAAHQRAVVATPGVHTIAVVVQSSFPPGNGSNLLAELGQTHVDVSK